MENTLERMVDRIYQEGISRAEEKARSIVAEAEAKAQQVLAQAASESARVLAEAERQANDKKRSTEAELRAAAARVITGLKHDIGSLLRDRVVTRPVKAALSDVEFIKEVILAIVKQQQGREFAIVLSQAQQAVLVESLRAAMQEKLAQLEIQGDNRKSGFSIVAKGAGYELEFSEHALADFLEPHVKQATAELMR